MSEHVAWSALALFGLGAFHGMNPGMGWLFAVALGIQEGRARAVWRALLPLAVGHLLAVGLVLACVAVTGIVMSPAVLRPPVALVLIGLGAYRIVRHRHARWTGMRVSLASLTLWSFMMAAAHGAGLMILPLVLDAGSTISAASGGRSARAGHAGHMTSTTSAERSTASATGDIAADHRLGALAASAVHTAGYLIVLSLFAWLLYVRVGLGVLRTAWINLDLVWAVALLITGGWTLVG